MGVNSRRRYDATRRRAQAASTHDAILDVARRRLLELGYAGTTVAQIADEADTSIETINKVFGGKSGLVRALWGRSLEGRGAVPASERSDSLSSTETDPVRVLHAWGRFTTELAPDMAPIVLHVRGAAAAHPDMAALYAEAEAQRRTRMRHNARLLQRRRWLRPGLGLARATDILWTYSSAELYELLVLKSGWTVKQYGDFVGSALIAALLPHEQSTSPVE